MLLGPFFIPNKQSGLVTPGVEHTGYDLEFSNPKTGARITIYRRLEEWRPGTFRLTQYLIRREELPFSISYSPFYAVKSPVGLFLPLHSVVIKLFDDGDGFKPLAKFLAEFHSLMPLHTDVFRSTNFEKNLLSPEFANMGYEVLDIMTYGRTVTIELFWVFPQERAKNKNADKAALSSSMIEFRPKPDRTLGPGKWKPPLPGTVNALLYKFLRGRCGDDPVHLLSPFGCETALSMFEWTPLTLMTPRQARQARIDFARKHPDLLDKPRDLATALRKAQLYSRHTEINTIV